MGTRLSTSTYPPSLDAHVSIRLQSQLVGNAKQITSSADGTAAFEVQYQNEKQTLRNEQITASLIGDLVDMAAQSAGTELPPALVPLRLLF